MPIYLDETDVIAEVAHLESVLIVPCRFCPAASMAIQSNEPYIEFPRRSLKTASYEDLIQRMKERFELGGVRTSVFRSNALHQFVLCMWTDKRRKQLLECARHYDALVVLGCEGAVQAVRDSVKSTGCRVIQGMRSQGLMSLKPKLQFPCKILLELESVTPPLDQEQRALPGT